MSDPIEEARRRYAEELRFTASGMPQATVAATDGFTFRPDQLADVIVVNAGVTHLSLVWLEALAACSWNGVRTKRPQTMSV